MAIRIEVPDSEWIEYIPDVLENRLDDDPMTVEIRPMSAADMRTLRSGYAAKLAGKGAQRRAEQLVRKILTERVREIKGCYVGRDISTGAELAEYGLSSMIDDVFQAVIDVSHLSEGLKKKLSLPSSSGPQDLPLSNGVE